VEARGQRLLESGATWPSLGACRSTTGEPVVPGRHKSRSKAFVIGLRRPSRPGDPIQPSTSTSTSRRQRLPPNVHVDLRALLSEAHRHAGRPVAQCAPRGRAELHVGGEGLARFDGYVALREHAASAAQEEAVRARRATGGAADPWRLITATHNLLRLHRHATRRRRPEPPPAENPNRRAGRKLTRLGTPFACRLTRTASGDQLAAGPVGESVLSATPAGIGVSRGGLADVACRGSGPAPGARLLAAAAASGEPRGDKDEHGSVREVERREPDAAGPARLRWCLCCLARCR
jgi:hypothetical protein